MIASLQTTGYGWHLYRMTYVDYTLPFYTEVLSPTLIQPNCLHLTGSSSIKLIAVWYWDVDVVVSPSAPQFKCKPCLWFRDDTLGPRDIVAVSMPCNVGCMIVSVWYWTGSKNEAEANSELANKQSKLDDAAQPPEQPDPRKRSSAARGSVNLVSEKGTTHHCEMWRSVSVNLASWLCISYSYCVVLGVRLVSCYCCQDYSFSLCSFGCFCGALYYLLSLLLS